jgi:cell wall-associated NlpC family hydrolase
VDLFGILLILVGAYFLSSAVKNRRPLRTLGDIIRDPKSANTILSASNGNGYVSQTNASGVQSVARQTYNNFSGTAATGTSAAGSVAVAWARSKIGLPYRLGAVGPNAYDCSSLVQQAWQAAGFVIPRTTYTQLVSAALETIDAPTQPGDLIYPHPGHVQMYTGSGSIVEAPRTGLNVREMPGTPTSWYAVRRVRTVR